MARTIAACGRLIYVDTGLLVGTARRRFLLIIRIAGKDNLLSQLGLFAAALSALVSLSLLTYQ